jgi:sorbitol/mannitol transport system substrate-binding protein
MWYDATSAADKIFDPAQNPDFADKTAVVFAPTKVKENSGWLWAWAFALAAGSKNKDAAYKFLEWATGKDYPALVYMTEGSWGLAPSGARQSLYENADYAAYGAAFNPVVLEALNTVDPNNATVFEDTPYTGIQFVQIPEFQKLGDDCTKEFAGAITGNQTPDQAIANCQKFAQAVGDEYK